MIEALVGSLNCERVLVFLEAREQGYAREMADFYATGLGPIQKQLEKLERGGVLVSRSVGRTRLYEFNPRYPFLKELKSLMEKVISFYPEDEREKLLMVRKRPRRKGKPV
jgi:hypothetical protein